ncbi:MAG: LamB/YcsF family protein [Pseudohongiellaceae bacterium]
MKTQINCDMGESFGIYQMGDDAALMPLISVANVACGFHASDYNHMRKTVRLAQEHGVKVGAHPSLPDLQGFGRREMKLKRDDLANCIIYQVGALKGFLDAEKMPLNHIKPHGSLYGMAARDEEIAHAVCDAAEVFGVPLFGMINCAHEKIYGERGIKFVAEYYADLEYTDEGGLIITQEHDAVDPERAATRALRALQEGKAESVGGKDVEVRADSICVHSDTPNAPEVAAAVHDSVREYLAA